MALRDLSLGLYGEMEKLKKEAQTADARAVERLMKKFMET